MDHGVYHEDIGNKGKMLLMDKEKVEGSMEWTS